MGKKKINEKEIKKINEKEIYEIIVSEQESRCAKNKYEELKREILEKKLTTGDPFWDYAMVKGEFGKIEKLYRCLKNLDDILKKEKKIPIFAIYWIEGETYKIDSFVIKGEVTNYHPRITVGIHDGSGIKIDDEYTAKIYLTKGLSFSSWWSSLGYDEVWKNIRNTTKEIYPSQLFNINNKVEVSYISLHQRGIPTGIYTGDKALKAFLEQFSGRLKRYNIPPPKTIKDLKNTIEELGIRALSEQLSDESTESLMRRVKERLLLHKNPEELKHIIDELRKDPTIEKIYKKVMEIANQTRDKELQIIAEVLKKRIPC